jgi:galactose mutarotase-like enzyme
MKLTNNILSIEVAEHGAELISLKKDDREYMWSGDLAFWNRHAPILFPAVGKPFENTIRIDSKTYPMKQHGFARDSEYETCGDGRLRMVNVDRTEQYPYRFSLEAEYRLDGSRVEITWTVTNRDRRDMHFQIGAHPGFMLPNYDAADKVHGYVRYYDKDGVSVSPVITSALDDGNRIPLPTPRSIPANMPLEADTFAHDALIFEDAQVATAELCDKQGRPVLSVSCPQAEAFGIWAPHKEGCPFVCLEPWCGICDAKGFAGDISQRTYSHRLAPQEHYRFTYTIHIL